ncbi:MAG TPA: PhzF family phenazine biosynthesis protein [Solirubrobacteraceae bacterium]|jgi:trans-2,3-dihydro-3-hydroxyanthranilate isomerase|nr:PhzF family phenazine biosynthesis protein [Solirubrobacteraceae bacterium]
MTGLRFAIVDVFSATPLAGNALCVVLDRCPPELMASIAREMNLSETTFPQVTGPGAYEMRIFTPSTELPFAGHPSLGSAWALGPGAWTQTTSGARVAVTAEADGARLLAPEPELAELSGAVAEQAVAAVGLEPKSVEAVVRATAGGISHLLVATTQAIGGLAPSPDRVRRASIAAEAMSIAPFARRGTARLHARVFAPAAGVSEDPGTGSAAGSIGVLAGRLWDLDTELVIEQGAEIGRPCLLEVSLAGRQPQVGGRVTLCAQGTLRLDRLLTS